MAIKRTDNRARLVISAAQDHRGTAIRQFDQERIALGNAVRMRDHRADLIKGHATDDFPSRLDFHEAAITREVAAFLTDINNLIQ